MINIIYIFLTIKAKQKYSNKMFFWSFILVHEALLKKNLHYQVEVQVFVPSFDNVSSTQHHPKQHHTP